MIKPLIDLITNESCDWKVLRMNLGLGYEFANHNIPDFAWIDLLNKLGFKVEKIKISDEDMEEGNY